MTTCLLYKNKPRRGSASESSYSLIMEVMQEFLADATCLDHLWRQRFSKDGSYADCPKCGELRPFHRINTRPSYSCDYCGHHI